MIVVPPFAVDQSVITATNLPEVDNSKNEIAWRPFRPDLKQVLISNDAFDITYIHYYKDGMFLAVDSTEQKVFICKKQQSDLRRTDVVEFFPVAIVPDFVAYSNGLIFVSELDGNTLYVYNEDGGLETSIVTQVNDNHKSMCEITDGIIALFTEQAGTLIYRVIFASLPFTFAGNVITSYDAPILFETDGMDSVTSDGQKLYIVNSVDYDIYVYPIYQSNPTVEITKLGVYGAISYDKLLRRICWEVRGSGEVFEYTNTTNDQLTWLAGDEIVYNTYRYICKTTGTLNPPTDTNDWELISGGIDGLRANKYSAFDKTVSSPSLAEDTWTATFDFNSQFDTVGFFNLIGDQLNITINDDTYGEIYNQDFSLIDNSQIDDYFPYFTYPLEYLKSLAVFNLIAYTTSSITITITGSGQVGVGELVIGQSKSLGTTQYGTGGSLFDYSRVITDDFGNISIEKRRNVKNIEYDVKLPTSQLQRVYDAVSSLTNDPCLWVGETENDPTGGFTTVYGIYDTLQENATSPTLSDLTLKIQGLV